MESVLFSLSLSQLNFLRINVASKSFTFLFLSNVCSVCSHSLREIEKNIQIEAVLKFHTLSLRNMFQECPKNLGKWKWNFQNVGLQEEKMGLWKLKKGGFI